MIEGKSKGCHPKAGSNMIYRPVSIEHNEGVLKAGEKARNREIKQRKQLINSSGKVTIKFLLLL